MRFAKLVTIGVLLSAACSSKRDSSATADEGSSGADDDSSTSNGPNETSTGGSSGASTASGTAGPSGSDDGGSASGSASNGTSNDTGADTAADSASGSGEATSESSDDGDSSDGGDSTTRADSSTGGPPCGECPDECSELDEDQCEARGCKPIHGGRLETVSGEFETWCVGEQEYIGCVDADASCPGAAVLVCDERSNLWEASCVPMNWVECAVSGEVTGPCAR